MSLLDVMATLSLDSSKYVQGMKDSETLAGKFGNAAKVAGAVAVTAFAAVGTTVVAGATALTKSVSAVAAYGDEIDKMSQKIGISAEAYQEWDAVLQHSGTDISVMKASMKTLASQANKNSEAFQALGISQEQVASMSREDLFAEVITGLQNMESEAERSAIATELLGKGAIEMGALLNTSAEETEAMRKKVHQLGGVMSSDAVKAAAKFQDSLQDMKTAMSGLKNQMTSEFLPAFSDVMDGITEIFGGNYEEGVDKMSQGIEAIVGKVTDMLPRVMELGGRILMSLAQGIINSLPQITTAATNVLLMFVESITKNLPSIFKAGITMLVEIGKGIAKAIPQLIPIAVDAVMQVVETLIDNIGLLVDTGIEIILALIDGIIQAIPRLLEKMPEIIQKVLQAFSENMPKLIEAGVQLITMLIDGIVQNLPTLIAMAPVIIQSVLQALIQNLPQLIIGGIKMIPEIVKGIIQAIPELLKAVPQLISALLGSLVEKAKDLINAGKEMINKVKEGIKQKIDDAKQWGQDLIQNFKDGISRRWESLKNGIKNIGQGIKNLLGFSEPKEGPLSDFHTYAPDMMDLFAKGVKQNEDVVYDQLKKSFNFDDILDDMSPTMNIKASADAGAGTSDGEEPITIVLQNVLDGRVIGETSYKYIKGRLKVGGALV